jgi:hypothetical protein
MARVARLSFLLLLAASPILAQDLSGRPKGAAKVIRMRHLQDALDTVIDAKELQSPNQTLKVFLERLEAALKRKGKGVPIRIEFDAFKEENPDAYKEPPDLYDVRVPFPADPARVTVREALQRAFEKVPTSNAVFALRPGTLVVTTVARAWTPARFQQRVYAAFDNKPYVEALDDLFELTGVHVTLDRRVADQARAPVTATFTNDVSLQTALAFLTDMAGLKLLVVEDGLYVTALANARALEREAYRRLRQSLGLPGRRGQTSPDR